MARDVSSCLPFPEGRYRDAVFDIGRVRGFLPVEDPSPVLPPSFQPLQNLLDALPLWLDGGARGILGTEGRIVDEVAALPNLLAEVEALTADKSVENGRALQVVFRGYTFLASAFLLEKAFYEQTPDGTYGKARRVLPAQVAQPLACAAEALDQQPWLDYHYSYALGNYVRIHPSKGFGWKNLKMAVRFTGTKDENGFVMLHVTINAKSGALLGAISDTLLGARRGDNHLMVSGLNSALETLRDMNLLRREMWKASRPDHYNDFRVFIMGVHGNTSIFGDGVVYEGVERFSGRPQTPRGQTGAQDDIIPTCDIFGGVTRFYPHNQLTEYLLDLRRYRPRVLQAFFNGLEEEIEMSGLPARVGGHAAAAALMLAFLEQIYVFRAGHWQFVLRYIMMATRHAVATGGTPITSWLPNQMGAVLDAMQALLDALNSDTGLHNASNAGDAPMAPHHHPHHAHPGRRVSDDAASVHHLAPLTPELVGRHHDEEEDEPADRCQGARAVAAPAWSETGVDAMEMGGSIPAHPSPASPHMAPTAPLGGSSGVHNTTISANALVGGSSACTCGAPVTPRSAGASSNSGTPTNPAQVCRRLRDELPPYHARLRIMVGLIIIIRSISIRSISIMQLLAIIWRVVAAGSRAKDTTTSTRSSHRRPWWPWRLATRPSGRTHARADKATEGATEVGRLLLASMVAVVAAAAAVAV
eukprot:jgi/Mesvir1/18262/Mv09532-RA.1